MGSATQPVDARAERRAQLLGIARRRFVQDGFGGTSVSAIVRDAGVAQGTFYLYFENKQAVLAELRREVFREYVTSLAQAASTPGPTDARLVEVVLAMVACVDRHLELERVFRQADSAHALEEAALEGRARLAGMAADLLREGEGLTADPGTERVVAELLVTLFDTVLYEAWSYQRPAPVAQTVRVSLSLVLRGLGVGEERLQVLLARIPTTMTRTSEESV